MSVNETGGRLLAYVWTSPPVERSDDEVRKCMHNAVLLAVMAD